MEVSCDGSLEKEMPEGKTGLQKNGGRHPAVPRAELEGYRRDPALGRSVFI